MDELECMRTIDENLQAVPDESARVRVANWIVSKYLGQHVTIPPFNKAGRPSDTVSLGENAKSGEIPGIAKLSQSGDLQLTVRDFKAKSANDAAIRLVHVLIWATSKLTGVGSVSSKLVIVPCLRKYRCYDGNTRGAIAKDKGLVRDGDELSLDFHAEQLAEKFVGEIQDSSIEGKWKPGATKRRATKAPVDANTGAS